MINGCDLSSHNFLNYKTIIRNKGNAFAIIKATEGKTYKNPFMKAMADYAVQQGKLVGFYHYARPENNTAEEEAATFCDVVAPYIGNAILVLDYEGKSHNFGASWAAAWINAVKKKTGVLPLFYTSESYLKNYGDVAKTGAGLWVAKYSTKRPAIYPWTLMAIWQYTDKPYDKDHFYGDAKAWAAYAKVRK